MNQRSKPEILSAIKARANLFKTVVKNAKIISISFSKSEITFKTIECTLMYFDMMLSGENLLAD